MLSLTLAEAAALWDVQPGYLNSSSYGPPPRPAFDALTAALDDWRLGRVSWEGWADTADTSRALFAGLVGTTPEQVATGATVSQLLAPLGVALPDGATVLVPDVEFTSAVFPFAVHSGRGIRVRTAPLAGFADAITTDVDVVSFSAVQSAGGEVADIAGITARAAEVGALTVMDATQAAGWLPLNAESVDLLVCHAYKWLCSPRGTAFLTLHPSLADRHPTITDRMLPLAAGWFAGEPVHGSYYGMPMRLAAEARRFDISPAWHCWVGTAPALEIIAAVGPATIGAHNVALANDFLTRLDQPPGDSAIVSVAADEAALARLHDAGIRFGVRAGRARVAFHLYSTSTDVDAAVAAVAGSVRA